MSDLKVVENVIPMHETKSKHDIMVKGVMVKLELQPCQCGIHAMWVTEVPARDMLPPGLREIVQTDQKVKKIVNEFHYAPKWWWKFAGRTLDRELKTWIRKSRFELENVAKVEATVEALRKEIEC